MNFQEILKHLMNGEHIRRSSWGEGLFMVQCNNVVRVMLTDELIHIGERFSLEDVLATDWELYDDVPADKDTKIVLPKFKEVDFCCGSSIDEALKTLQHEAEVSGTICFGDFNGNKIYSSDTIDEAYVKVTGKTKAEHDKEKQEWLDGYNRREDEFKEKNPALTEDYRKRARGLVLDEQLEYWDEIVPVRLGDLYHGMELDQVLEYCRIMRNEEVEYNTRLHECYKTFMNSGHSGMSAGLTASMIKVFCPNGEDLADAVMNFRFGDDN